jgi:hypothetical protein
MPIERELSKVIAMSDADLFQWRANVRQTLDGSDDAQLSALLAASMDEIVHRARQAWAVVDECNARRAVGAA